MNNRNSTYGDDEELSLLYIQALEGSPGLLRQAAGRIARNVRCTDTVLLREKNCSVVLPKTPLSGAEAVARRVSLLLVDIEYKLHVLYGVAALTQLQYLETKQALVVTREEYPRGKGVQASPGSTTRSIVEPGEACTPLPFLAFLPNYPSRRVLHLFPYELACRYQCVPVGVERDMLTIATCQGLDSDAIAHFQKVTKRRIFLVRCEASIIDDILSFWKNRESDEIVRPKELVYAREGSV